MSGSYLDLAEVAQTQLVAGAIGTANGVRAAETAASPITSRINQPLIPPRSALRAQFDPGRSRSNSHAISRPDPSGPSDAAPLAVSPNGGKTPPTSGHSFSRSYSHALGTPVDSSMDTETTDSRDVFAAVRGLRGDQTPMRAKTPPLYSHEQSPMSELSFAPEGYLEGEKDIVSFTGAGTGTVAGARQGHLAAATDQETDGEELAEEEVLGRIASALARSTDSGDTLDLSRKGITAIGPLAVQQFRRGVGKENKGVWRLALSHNRLDSFSIDPSFSLLSRLRYLNLKGNHLTQFPPPLSDMPSLEILDLSKNKISSFPVEPGRLIYLNVLSMSHNKLYSLPEYIADFDVMTVFKVDDNPLEWPPKEVMGALTNQDQPVARDASTRTREKQREAELRPWIANMKHWIREQVAQASIATGKGALGDVTPTSSGFGQSGRRSSTMPHVAEPARLQAFTFGQAPAVSPSAQTTVRPVKHADDASHGRTDSTESRDRQLTKPPPLRLVTSHAREPSSASLPSAISSTSTHSRQPSAIVSTPYLPTIVSSTSGHSRGSSLMTQRLSGLLSSKKSLPDLRKSHAQIMQDRRESGTSPAVPARYSGDRTPHSAISVPSLSPWSPPGRSPGTGKSFGSGGRHRLPRVGSADMLSRMRPNGGGLSPVTEHRNSQEGPPVDDSRNSYFRRLSTLPVSTISKTIPDALLSFVDGIRGILFALSQLHSALKQYLLFAANDRVAGLFSRVMDTAGAQTTALINALDRFDAMSRRRLPPPAAVKGVIDAARNSIAAFAKVVAMLRLQIPALQTSDTRYTRTLLLMVYGSMSEVSYSWTSMAPMLSGMPVSDEAANKPKKSHRNLAIGSFGGRTPISPIPERGESHSPPSVERINRIDRSMVNASPLKTSVSTSDLALSAVPSAESGSRRQGGSFSIQDVERGMLMSRSALGTARSPVKPSGHQATDSVQSTLSSLVSTEVSDSAFADDDDIYNLPPNPPFAYRANRSNGSSVNLPQTPPDTHSALQPIAMVPVRSGSPARGHKPASSAGSSNLNLTNGHAKGKSSVDLPGSAAAFDLDDDLLDVIEAATDVAFTAWLKLAEDIGGLPSRHLRTDSDGSDIRSIRPDTISPKDHANMLELLSTSETVTSQLRESLMGIRADPHSGHSEKSLHSRQALHAQSEAFVKTVVQVTGLVMKLSSQHAFSSAVRQCCAKLVQFTREFAILFQVSHTRPGTSASAYAASNHSQSQTSLLNHPHLANGHASRQQTEGSRSSSPVSAMTLTAARRRFAASSDNLSQPYSADGSQVSSAMAGTPKSAGLRGLRLPSRQAALGR